MSFEETEFTDLAEGLRAVRPAPEPEFTASLDQAVADHFPPEWADQATLGSKDRGRIGNFGERMRRRLDGSRALLPTLAGVVGALFVVAVVVANTSNGPSGTGRDQSTSDSQIAQESSSASKGITDSAAGAAAMYETYDQSAPAAQAGAMADFADKARNREVAREAEITLGTDPSGVQDVANEVVAVTDDHNGIVMDSTVTDGEEGAAGASFQLLIPSGQIESAVADLSGIADLRSRSQELTDITAPTNSAEDAITDSKAKIESLLGELEETYDEDERAALEQRIRWERNDLRRQETRLKRLERRADYTPVSLTVETGGDQASGDESGWGLADAIDDAGKLLGVAAGVTVLALAVAIPIGIVVLIALALNRAWVRRSRRQALEDDE